MKYCAAAAQRKGKTKGRTRCLYMELSLMKYYWDWIFIPDVFMWSRCFVNMYFILKLTEINLNTFVYSALYFDCYSVWCDEGKLESHRLHRCLCVFCGCNHQQVAANFKYLDRVPLRLDTSSVDKHISLAVLNRQSFNLLIKVCKFLSLQW